MNNLQKIYSNFSVNKWTVVKGTRTVYVGAASDNLILNADITIN